MHRFHVFSIYTVCQKDQVETRARIRAFYLVKNEEVEPGEAIGDTISGLSSTHWQLFVLSLPSTPIADVERDRGFADSPVEGAGFELSVPRQMDLCKHRESPRIATPGRRLAGN